MTIKISSNALTNAKFSFALRGEDLVLAHYFKSLLNDGHPGVYVDVGAGAPSLISNTYLFYLYGWSGVCIDANPGLAPSWARERPRDKFISAAVAESPGETLFFRHTKNTGMSTVGAQKPEGDFEVGVVVPIFRLDALLSHSLADKKVDLFTLDVEGAELGVLASNDWDRWRPPVVILECHGFDFAKPVASPPVAFLRDRGYRIDQKVGANVVMVWSA